LSTFLTLQNLVKVAIGGRDDSDALLVIKAAINYSALIAAILYKPNELKTQSDVVFAGGSSFHNLSSLNWQEIHRVWNTTDSILLKFIPYELLDSILPTLTATKYCSIYGEGLYLRKSPSTSKTLKISYIAYPAELVDDIDALEFSTYDSFIISLATSLTFAAFEEMESSALHQKVADYLGQPLTLSSKEKNLISKQQVYFDLSLQQMRKE
jgi:hypothetical protein